MSTSPFLLRLVRVLGGIVLGLGLAAGLLYAGTVVAPEYLPIAHAAMGLGGLGLGYLLGQALRPLGRWRPPVPLSVETAALPLEGIGQVWIRGFAAGFWMLAVLGATTTALDEFLIRPAAAGPTLWGIGLPMILLFGGLLVFAVPMAVARGAVGSGEALPRWTLVVAAGVAWAGGVGLFIGTWVLMVFLSPSQPGVVGYLTGLLALASVPVAAVGTPVLVRDRWPSRRGLAWSLLLALLAFGAAWLFYVCLDGWISPLGLTGVSVWLLSGCLLWGGPAGAVLVVAAARRKAAVARAGSAGPRRVGPVALAAGGLGLFCLGLLPLAAWVLYTVLPGPPPLPTPAAPPSSPIPSATQPGFLPIAGPALLTPAAGTSMAGPLWSFFWRPPPGATPADLYQFTLWPPSAALPAAQIVSRGATIRIGASGLLQPPRSRVGLPAPNAARQNGRWPSGPWTWRVRVIRPGQGAGQWSEARPFTFR